MPVLTPSNVFTPGENPKKSETIQLLEEMTTRITNIEARLDEIDVRLPFKVLSCILRPDGSGNWSALEDADHESLLVTSVSQTSESIRVNYSFTATKVLYFGAVADESLALALISCGAGAGLTYAGIQLADVNDSPINPSSITNTLSNVWCLGLFLV